MGFLKLLAVLGAVGFLAAGCIDPNTGRLMGMDAGPTKTVAPASDPGQASPNGQETQPADNSQ